MKQFFYLLLLCVCASLELTGQMATIRHDGVLVPAMTAVDMLAISSPEEGHTVYNTTTKSLTYFDGLTWTAICPSPLIKDGTVIRQKAGFESDDFIFGKKDLPIEGELVTENFFFFDENNGAMRGGRLWNSDAWEPSKIGTFSFGWGNKVEASGTLGATAIGQEAAATGDFGATSLGDNTIAAGKNGATALGYQTEAQGDSGSTAFGDKSVSNGDRGSMALGFENVTEGNNGAAAIGAYLIANANSGVVVGRWNKPIVSAASPYDATTPVFMVGNGDSETFRRNAMVVKQSGNTDLNGKVNIASDLNVAREINSRRHINLNSIFIDDEINLNFNLDRLGNSATGFGNIRWSDDDGGEFAKIEAFSNQGGSAIPEYMSLQAGIGGTEENHFTLWQGNASLGPNKFQTGGASRFIVAHDSKADDPQIRIMELDEGLFGRVQYTNVGSTHNFSMSANPGSTYPRWEVSYDGEDILTILADDIQSGGSNGRIGINDLFPTFALELPNDPDQNIGCARAFSWETYSDSRVNKNVQPIESAIDKTMALQPVYYNHHNSKFENGTLKVNDQYNEAMGFIAQDLHKVLPNAASKPKDENEDYWSINYASVIPLLTKAIQEQQVMIQELQETISTLVKKDNLQLSSNK